MEKKEHMCMKPSKNLTHYFSKLPLEYTLVMDVGGPKHLRCLSQCPYIEVVHSLLRNKMAHHMSSLGT